MRSVNQLEQDYYYCKKIIQRNSKSFYYAFSQLPKEKANAVFAIYAFCRLADDSVDEARTTEEQVERLDRLELELSRFEKGVLVDHPIWRALHDVFTRYDMNISHFYDQLKGQRMDLYFSYPKTMEQVEEYSYYVAGSVGLMLLQIIAARANKDLTNQAIRLGIAMQITNILRDIGEDYQANGRIYIPEQEMLTVSYTETDLANAVINDSFIYIWEKMAHHAEKFYDDFLDHLQYFDQDSRVPVAISAKVYRRILTAVRENNYDCFKTRNAVPRVEMEKIYQTIQV
ncbi:phytoene/squalene synthase family protein [Virgibacillus sp. NKC19-16]|uniref:phytoene/squalene synthase family protein n=1 Tax=Virgibacillus salidurans TaxID=2831673 RepID=UPI001F410118|nr:phytoene/squalene synthase family protein [Virgibacillus sp. NKC19-16]UJL46161.1 phytoene/squalene synthase family protein [Virgibacillus sp. NKC19-16]